MNDTMIVKTKERLKYFEEIISFIVMADGKHVTYDQIKNRFLIKDTSDFINTKRIVKSAIRNACLEKGIVIGLNHREGYFLIKSWADFDKHIENLNSKIYNLQEEKILLIGAAGRATLLFFNGIDKNTHA